MLNLLWSIFTAMARVGIFGYGGGPSVIPLIQKEAVGAQWMTADDFAAALAMGNALPGPIATKMSAYIGYTVLMERTNNNLIALLGALSGVLGMVVPSFIMMLVLAVGFLQFKDYPQVKGALQAVKPVIVGLLAYTAWTVVPQPLRMDSVWIAVLSFLLLVTWDVHPVILILAATIFGAFVYAR
jgi:chromate transporter